MRGIPICNQKFGYYNNLREFEGRRWLKKWEDDDGGERKERERPKCDLLFLWNDKHTYYIHIIILITIIKNLVNGLNPSIYLFIIR